MLRGAPTNHHNHKETPTPPSTCSMEPQTFESCSPDMGTDYPPTRAVGFWTSNRLVVGRLATSRKILWPLITTATTSLCR